MKSLFIILSVFGWLFNTGAADENPLDLSLTLNQEEYAWNDRMELTVGLFNSGTEDVWVTFPDACYFTVTVQSETGEVLAEQEEVCVQVIAEVEIFSGQLFEMNETIELDALAGLSAGNYSVVVETSATIRTESTNQSFEFETIQSDFELTRPLLVTYTLDQMEYEQNEVIEITYTIQNEGGEAYDLNLVSTCDPSVSLFDANTDELVFDEESREENCTEMMSTVTVDAEQSHSETKLFALYDYIEPNIYYLKLDFNAHARSELFMVLGDGFRDVSGHWAEDYITTLYLEGVVEEYDSYWFKPDQAITRAEFLKILFATEDLQTLSEEELDTSASYFSDVNEEDWYYTYTQSAYETGIVNGYENATFAPNEPISRAEAVSTWWSTLWA